jgi:nucleoside-diphosphate kinase
MRERTFVILKPDTIQRSLVGTVMSMFERTGLKLVAIKMLKPDEQLLLSHYGKDDTWYREKGAKRMEFLRSADKTVDDGRGPLEYGKDIIRGIVRYMTASPVILMVWEGNQAVAVVKKLVGSTDPTASDVGTIRGDFQIDSYSLSDAEERALRNLVHCSDKVSEAQREIGIWFTPEELQDYRHINEAILQDVNLDGTRE